ncbi:MAG: hypothetical protein K0S08_1879 [Gammaproteobacteria bacterium]|jgi:hypothetical protein|nr:hypothetical protein [Gammaproteobacteria bacterium]
MPFSNEAIVQQLISLTSGCPDVYQAFLSKLEENTIPQERLQLFKMQFGGRRGYSQNLGMVIARYQDSRTTQSYLNSLNNLLTQGIPAKDLLGLLLQQNDDNDTIGTMITHYQDELAIHQYFVLLRDLSKQKHDIPIQDLIKISFSHKLDLKRVFHYLPIARRGCLNLLKDLIVYNEPAKEILDAFFSWESDYQFNSREVLQFYLFALERISSMPPFNGDTFKYYIRLAEELYLQVSRREEDPYHKFFIGLMQIKNPLARNILALEFVSCFPENDRKVLGADKRLLPKLTQLYQLVKSYDFTIPQARAWMKHGERIRVLLRYRQGYTDIPHEIKLIIISKLTGLTELEVIDLTQKQEFYFKHKIIINGFSKRAYAEMSFFSSQKTAESRSSFKSEVIKLVKGTKENTSIFSVAPLFYHAAMTDAAQYTRTHFHISELKTELLREADQEDKSLQELHY